MMVTNATPFQPDNPQTRKIFLFDIDSVLVRPHGYRVSIHRVVDFFTQAMQLPPDLKPNEDDFSFFESRQITSEWDMIPIILAAILDGLVAANPDLIVPARVNELPQLRPSVFPIRIDYRAPADAIHIHLQTGKYPAEVALALLETASPQIFPYLAGHPVGAELFSATRSPAHCYPTRVFQHFTLGSQEYARAYHTPAEFETPSLLMTLDQPLLSSELAGQIYELWQTGDIAAAAYTLRPSGPPRDLVVPPNGYAPEAEIALSQVGLRFLPLIGYGHIHYLAGGQVEQTESFAKPSPMHALAAIFAALTRQEALAVQMAEAIFHDKPLPTQAPSLRDLPGLDIHIFEDSAGSIGGVRQAGEILNQHGLKARVTGWGIADHPIKIEALVKIGVRVSPSIEIALRAALQSLPPGFS